MTHAVAARAPLRLSLAGGGTDLPEWYTRHGAHLLAVAIDRTVVVRRVAHGGTDSPLVRVGRAQVPALGPVTVDSDVSAGAGLGGSGAVGVALAALACAVTGEEATAREVALRAYAWERDVLGRPSGFQDQLCSAVGGCVEMTATPDGAIDAHRRIDLEDDLDHLLSHAIVVAETGVRREAAGALHGLASSLSGQRGDGAGGLATVGDVVAAISARDGEAFGNVLRRHWAAKLRLSPDATWPAAERALVAAAEAGATGGKVVGAGGGGFILCAGPPRARADVWAALTESGCAPVELRVAREGVQVERTSHTTGDTAGQSR